MRRNWATCAKRFAISGGLLAASAVHAQSPTEFVLEAYPPEIVASKQNYQKHLAAASAGVTSVPFYLITPTLHRWAPGQTVRVAFRGGTTDLQNRIAAAAAAWTTQGGANIKLDFKDAAGRFRTWSPTDTGYAAEIRISFNAAGYWSHVGNDSINTALVGGRPGQASMNFHGFEQALPGDWAATVVHEFGHALGFEHEHQNPIGGCDFRFEDDPGYVPAKNADGWYVNDGSNRRPGLYTYLGGYANFWPKERVDANLRALQTSSAFLVGAFDKDSIMKYHFDAFMFAAGAKSPCYTERANEKLSLQDIVGVKRAYPNDPAAIQLLQNLRRQTLQQLRVSPLSGLELQENFTRQLNSF